MTKRWSLQEAKERLSEIVRAAEKEPQIITHRGKPLAEVRAIDTPTAKSALRKSKSQKQTKPKSLWEALQSRPYPIELPPRR